MPPPVLASVIVGALARARRGARSARRAGRAARDRAPRHLAAEHHVGADGVARLLDFGVAKARARLHDDAGRPPERKDPVHGARSSSPATPRGSRTSTPWGSSSGRCWRGGRLFSADTEIQAMSLVQRSEIAPPSRFADGVPNELDRICGKALARSPQDRYASAYEMARDIESERRVGVGDARERLDDRGRGCRDRGAREAGSRGGERAERHLEARNPRRSLRAEHPSGGVPVGRRLPRSPRRSRRRAKPPRKSSRRSPRWRKSPIRPCATSPRRWPSAPCAT